MVRTQIQLTEQQAVMLKKLASKRHASIAEIIRQAIDAVVRSESDVDEGERKKRAMNAIGRFGSGKQDVSLNHDRYLAEDFKK